MARQFASASEQYLEIADTIVEIDGGTGTAIYPLTMACWFRPATSGQQQNLMSIGDSTGTADEIALAIVDDSSNDAVVAYSRRGGTSLAASTTTWSPDTWHHAAGIWAAVDERYAYLDGGGEGSDGGARNATSLDTFRIAARARSTPGNPLNGQVGEAAIWNVVLTAAELAELAAGKPPEKVRSQNIIFCLRMVRDDDNDLMESRSLTPVNSPTIAPHPPVYRIAPPVIGYAAAAAGGETEISGEDGALLQSAEAGAVSQVHLIGAVDAGLDQTTEAGAVSQVHLIGAVDAGLDQTTEAGAISQTHLVGATDLFHVQTAENGAISTEMQIEAVDSNLAQIAENGTIQQSHVVSGAAGVLGQLAEAGGLAQTHVIGAVDGFLAQSVDYGLLPSGDAVVRVVTLAGEFEMVIVLAGEFEMMTSLAGEFEKVIILAGEL